MVSKIHQYILVEQQERDSERPWSKCIEPEAAENFELQHTRLDPILDHRFEIPEYQRPYEWEEEQWNQLWEEFEPLIHWSGRKISDVFFGSMFTAEQKNAKKYDYHEVIDGQQRLTTIHILLYAILRQLESEDYPDAENIIMYLKNRLYDIDAHHKIPRLSPFHENEIYKSLVDSSSPSEKIELVHALEHRHHATKNNVIRTRNLLKIFDLDESEYIEATLEKQISGEQKVSSISPKVKKSISENNGTISDVEDDDIERILKGKLGLSSSQTRMLKCFEFYSDKITDTLSEINDPTIEQNLLINIVNFIKRHFWVGHFTFRDVRPSLLMRVFEMLNLGGVDLKKADIINKNLVSVAYEANKDPQETNLIKTWREIIDELDTENIVEFIKTYLIVQKEATQRAKLKDSFIDVFSPSNQYSPTDIESRVSSYEEAVKFIEELHQYAKLYADIIDPLNRGFKFEKMESETHELNEILFRISGYQTSMWEPLVLGYYYEYRYGSAGELNHFKKVLETIESVIIRKYLGMDTHAKDRLFEKGIRAFWSHNVSNEVIQAVGDVKTEDPNYYGERLITELSRMNYKNRQARLILRKINSYELTDPDSGGILKLENEDVQAEHIFPQAPAGESTWFIRFFSLKNSEDYSHLNRVMQKGNRDAKIAAAESFIQDLGNYMLLKGNVNSEISNNVFSKKLEKIAQRIDFKHMPTNKLLIDIWEDFDNSEADDGRWNVDTLTQNRTYYVKLLVDCLGIGEEFDNIDQLDSKIENISSEVTVQKLELIDVNHRL